jgi:hypothetical protein
MAINKNVTENSVVEILREAKRNGWRGAKFYFMIGLPLPHPPETGVICEEEEIVNFVNNIARRTSMHFNINVGIFVPKPHTPYQRVRQLDSETAAAKLEFIRSRLKPRGHKVSVSDPLTSVLEGVLSRGDERAGDLAEEAFLAGSRLDPWQEFIDKDAWRAVLEKNPGLVEEFLGAKEPDTPLPWRPVVSGVSPAYMQKEFEKSERGELSPPCAEKCAEPCGVCGGVSAVPGTEQRCQAPASGVRHPNVWRLLFSFTKEGSAVFHGHLSLIEIFSMALTRAGMDVLYTQGFNPLAKLEIVAPLSVGISAGAEIAAVDFGHSVDASEFTERMNAALVEGIRINQAECFMIPLGAKKHSLSSLLWGFGYQMRNEELEMRNGDCNSSDGIAPELYPDTSDKNPQSPTEYVPAAGEKAFREKCLGAEGTVFSLRRVCVLAKNIIANGNDSQQPWESYFNVYGRLYQ